MSNLSVEYYKHLHGCGSGHSRFYIKKEENKVELFIKYKWMGSEELHCSLTGEYLNIDDNYSVIIFDKYKHQNETIDIHLAFDVYMFNNPLKTEWFQHQDKYSIGLYCGNGCHSTEKFQLHLIYNSDITEPIDKCWDRLIRIIRNLKYEKINVDEFDKNYK